MNRMRTALAAAAILALLATSCNTLDKQAAGVIMVVDRAMTAWAGYVVSARDTGAVPAEKLDAQEKQVRMIYAEYQRLMAQYDILRKIGEKDEARDTLTQVDEAAKAVSHTVTTLMTQ